MNFNFTRFTKAQFYFGFVLSLTFCLNAQQSIQPCNTYAAMEAYFKDHPEARARYESEQDKFKVEYEKAIAFRDAQRSAAAFVYTVPVVFHILHTGGPENISDQLCINALAQVNKDYAKAGTDVNSIAQPFQNRYINSDIVFQLAHKDPNGNCTSGIVHRYDSRTDWTQSNTNNYNGITWNPTKYLNIIIVKNIIPQGSVVGGGIIVGYTYKPGTWSAGASQDAIVYNYGFLSGLDARSLSHEIGHWFNLSHTFGNTNNPGVTCGDDGLYDTPPTKGNFSSCPSSLSGNACAVSGNTVWAAGQQNVENIMDYSSCPKNFTMDQTTAMRTALASAISNRQNLWQNANLIATDVANTTPCAPIAEYYSINSSYTVCAGGSLSFKDYSYNGPVTSYNWSGDLGAFASAPNNSVTIVTFPTIGVCNLSLTVGNAQGSTTKVRQIQVMDASPGIVAPHTEGFESIGLPTGWALINKNLGSVTWEQTWDAAYEGGASYFINGSTAGGAQEDALITPVIDVQANADKSFNLATAYAQKTSSHNDILKIEGSKDCGGTWQNIASLSASQMQLNSGGITAISYTPAFTEEWKVWNLDGYPGWSNFVNSPNVMVRFTFIEGTAGMGNNIYIDAINLFGGKPLGINTLGTASRIYVAPNPVRDVAKLYYNLLEPAQVSIQVQDLSGKLIYANATESQAAGNFIFDVPVQGLKSGLYLVNLKIDGFTHTRKILIP